MNKKMLTLLAFLVAITSIFAVFVEIGDGTTTTNYVPAYGLYDYSWSNYILTSAQIGNAIEINEIQFNVGNTPANYFMENQQVYMKLTSENEVTVAYPDPTNNGFTLVFDGSITWNEGGWQGVILDTEFSFDGSSNLQIVWENNDGTYVGGYPNFLKTDTGLNTAAYKYTDNSFPIVDGTLQTYFPNTRLGFAAEGAPAYPVIVSPENNTLNNELDTELVWTYGENTEFIHVYFSENEDDVVNNVETALVVNGELVTSYSPSLENASVYYWKVVASNSTSEIIAQTNVVSFSTTYGLAEVPYAEGFEEVTPPALPLGWMTYRESTTTYSYVETYSGQAYEGANSFRMANSSDTEGTYIAVLPQIENMSNRMKFWAKCSSAGAQIVVGYLADVTDAATFTEIQTIDLTSDYLEHTVELELPRTVRYLAFKHANVGTYQTIYLDNVLVEEIPANEPTPATLLTPENGATGVAMDAELTWEYGMNTVAVNLYLSDDMADVTDLVADAMVIDNQDVTSYTADLAEWTTYYWRVASLNSTGYEVLSAIYSFTTVTPEGTIQIGNGLEINQGMPIEPYYGYTYTQTIYPQADVNMAGDIQTIAWHYNGNSAWGPDDIKIYMAHTTLTSYETTESWVAADALTLVYDGTLSVPAVDGWVPITLDTPFNYNNTDNLLIAVEENTQGYHSNGDEFFNTIAEGNVSITYHSDSTDPDPTAPPTGTLKAYYPNIVLVIEEGETPVVYPSPTNLTAEIQNENEVHLAWNMPILPDEGGEWLYHGSGIYEDGFGTGGAFTYTGVVRYDAADLANYGGASLTQMKFYPRNAAATYTLKVWTGGSYDGTTFVPGTEVVSQLITDIETFAWNIVELDDAVTLAASEELWIGVETTTPNGYPLGRDAGPAVVGKGDLIFFNGGWNLISNLNNNYNFLIQAFVEGGRAIYRDPLEITAYNIYRNNSIIQSIADANDTTWVNTNVPNGVWEYKVTALYGTEMSEPSNIVVVDTTPPVYNPPTNFTAVIVNEFDVQINWNAPDARMRTLSREESMFGSASDNEITRDLTGYTLYRDNEILVEVGTDVLSYLDEALDYGTYQYKAVANYDEADSDPTPVVTIVIEEEEEILTPENLTASVMEDVVTLNWFAPGEAPEVMNESFENAFPPAGWSTVVNNTTESWAQYETVTFSTGDIVPTDGDYQAGVMWDYGAQDEWLITGEMTGITGITFDFYGQYGSEYGDNYYVKVSTDGGSNWTPVWNASDLPAGDNHYDTPISIDLSTYASTPIHIAWNFVDGDGQGLWYATYIDNIMFETSVATRSLKANELVAISKTVNTPVVRVDRELTGYKVYRDGEEIVTVGATVLTYADADLENGSYEYFVTAMYGDQESEASNTVEATVNVTIPGDYLIEDGFETYTDFALEAGPWNLVDGDLSGTYSITNTTWENAEAPQAYIVFNPTTTTPPLTDVAYGAYEGNKYMAAFASTTPANNDWMMTQEFTLGETGSFNFWAKSITDQYGLERFNVLVSNGSTNPNDFTSISGATFTTAPTAWTQFSYSLNAYANQTIRVAIQCVSNDAFIFMVDQVQIEAPGGTDIPNNDIAAVSQLIGNYPNPFNPETRIAFSTKENGPVSIDIFNIRGQKVKALLNENMVAGPHTVVWNGTDDNGKSVASGVFFYRMKSGKYTSTKKMILMK